jgi:DNA-binding response OmpR family regulator
VVVRARATGSGGVAMAKILCVDDELGVRRLLRRVLEPEGHAVSAAPDGVTGLSMACAEDWELVILDLLLPDLPGTAVLSAMLETKPDLRVIVLSAVGDTDSREASRVPDAEVSLTTTYAVRL